MPSSRADNNIETCDTRLKVTFDTNTLSGVVDPTQEADSSGFGAYQLVHAAVKTGQIRGFFSEAVVTLDAIGRKIKSEVLGATRFVSKTTSMGPRHISITMGPQWKSIEMDPRILARIDTARTMGLRALIGPRRFGDSVIAQGFGDDFYEPYPSGAAFFTAANIANDLDAEIVARGLGRAQVIRLGKSLSERDDAEGEWWPQGLERIRSVAEREKARLAINEWADGESLAAHAGYRHDLFCTHDNGGALGDKSILHPVNRTWLLEKHRIAFITIVELAERLAATTGRTKCR